MTDAARPDGRKIAPFDGLSSLGEDRHAAEEAVPSANDLNQHVLGYGDLVESEWASRELAAPNQDAMRRYRLQRVNAQLRKLDVAGVLVYDPVNIRYATDVTNMQVWCLHNPVRYAWVGVDESLILWEFHNCDHLSAHLPLIAEIRPSQSWYFFGNGGRMQEMAMRWASEVADVVRHGHGANSRIRIAVDRIDPLGAEALSQLGIDVVDGSEVMELARAVKSPDEILAMRRSLAACEAAVEEMFASMHVGMTENDVWSVMHAGNIRRGGEWIETRLLSSGPRTNPWFQESSSRVLERGDLVAFDTDLIGPYGYCSDFSRTWLVGEDEATLEQKALFSQARQQVEENIAILRPGMSFRDFAERAVSLPSDCLPNRYSLLAHGIGLCDEYPALPYLDDWDGSGYDGELVDGMTLSVESYVGRVGGREGVKLEQQVLLTPHGAETLSQFPYDAKLMV